MIQFESMDIILSKITIKDWRFNKFKKFVKSILLTGSGAY